MYLVPGSMGLRGGGGTFASAFTAPAGTPENTHVE